MKIKMKIDGLKELDQALGELSKATARRVMRKALEDAAQPMADLAQELAPKVTHQLENAIAVSAKVKNEAGKAAFAQVMRSGGSTAEARQALRDARRGAGKSFVQLYVGPSVDAPHAHLVEFGTEHSTPKPFMRPAFDRQAQPTLDRLAGSLRGEIDKAAKRAARKAARQAKKAAGGGA